MKKWTLNSWKNYPVKHIPKYEDEKKLNMVLKKIISENIRFTLEMPESNENLTPFLMTIPLQLLAYHVALLKNCDIDKPRNLAKSVTVE